MMWNISVQWGRRNLLKKRASWRWLWPVREKRPLEMVRPDLGWDATWGSREKLAILGVVGMLAPPVGV